MNRKVCLFIAMSLDGFIAKPDGDISFLSMVEKEGEDYGYARFIETVDTIILGRKTYEKILQMEVDLPYGDRNVYVVTRNPRPATNNIIFYSGSLTELITNLRRKDGKHIYCDGGAETILQLLQEDLIDELTVSVIPVLLGDGISLFGKNPWEKRLQLINSRSFEKGLVQLHYVSTRQ